LDLFTVLAHFRLHLFYLAGDLADDCRHAPFPPLFRHSVTMRRCDQISVFRDRLAAEASEHVASADDEFEFENEIAKLLALQLLEVGVDRVVTVSDNGNQ
jgi:hypothetical protein